MNVDLIEKAAEIVGDNQLLVNIVSKRVQQLNHGSDPYVPTTPEMGSGDIALLEIVEGKIQWHEMSEEELLNAREFSDDFDLSDLSEHEEPDFDATPEMLTITPDLDTESLDFNVDDDDDEIDKADLTIFE